MSQDEAELKGSEARLWKLIEERARPDSDTEALDQRIWDLFGEDWAVMFTDLAGFSRQVESFGILHFLQIILEQKRLLLPVVERHDGILIKMEADSFLIIFKRAERALDCAIAMQRTCQQVNARRPPQEQLLLCVGLGFGRILRIGDSDVFGAEVNAASKLGEDTAQANEILVTGAVRAALGERSDVSLSQLSAPVPGARTSFRVDYMTPT